MKPQERIEIHPHHRNRLAVAYVRRAMFPTTDLDQGNLEYQWAQRVHSYHWGWSLDKVQLIEDIGQAGRPTASRTGYDMLCGMIVLGQVGLVLAAEGARRGGSREDLALLLQLCQRAGTLVALDGKLLDWSNVYERLSTPPQVHESQRAGRVPRTPAGRRPWPRGTNTQRARRDRYRYGWWRSRLQMRPGRLMQTWAR